MFRGRSAACWGAGGAVCRWACSPPLPHRLCQVAFPAEPKATLQQATPINNGLEGERDRSYEPSKSGEEDGRGRGEEWIQREGWGRCQVPREAARRGAVFAWLGSVTQSPLTGMALSVLVILLLAVLYESIKVGKARLLYQALMNLSIPTSQQLIEETDQDSSSSDSLPVSRSPLR